MVEVTALGWLTSRRALLGSAGDASFSVSTLDNPGWALKVSAPKEAWSRDDAPPVQIDIDGEGWMAFKIVDRRFEAFGGPRTLTLLIGHLARIIEGVELASRDATLDALMSWYAERCDGDWEHDFGLRINGTAAGWEVIGNVRNLMRPLPASAHTEERPAEDGISVVGLDDRFYVRGPNESLDRVVKVATHLME